MQRLQHGESKPPRTIAPEHDTADDTETKSCVADTGMTVRRKDRGRVGSEQQEPQRASTDRTKRQPSRDAHVAFRQLVQGEPQMSSTRMLIASGTEQAHST